MGHYTDSFATLRAELVRRGYFRKATGHILAQFALLQAMAVGGLVLFLVSDVWTIKLLAIVLSGLGTLGISTNGHTASHYAVFQRKWANEFLTLFNYPLSLGVSAIFWWKKHVYVHHKVPNVIGEDWDAELLPYFAVCRQQITPHSGLRRFYYEHLQAFVIGLAISLNSLSAQLRGWAYLVRTWPGAPRERRMLYRLDLAALIAHYLLFLALPTLFFPWTMVLLAHVLRSLVFSYGAFAAFAPAHYPAGAVYTLSDEDADYVLRQTATTVNFRTGPFGRFLCAGVEYQIEHHLFPGISHVRYPQVSKLVEEYCRRHGYPYRSLSWARGVWESFVTFAQPKIAVDHLADWRSAVPAEKSPSHAASSSPQLSGSHSALLDREVAL